jgi:adenosine deaminase
MVLGLRQHGDTPGKTFPHECELAAPAAGLTREQIHQAQINAFETAFLSDEEKRSLREKHQGAAI